METKDYLLTYMMVQNVLV